jgi:catechol 2,3-dioxygenase-like lactoylglutathione lyase family enzyme
MFKPKGAFSGFSVNDLEKARKFYADTLGLQVETEGIGLRLHLPGAGTAFAYPKNDHQPATFTILNFVIDNIDEAVDDLKSRGVSFARYQGAPQDERGIMRKHGPPIAWFKDPAGNVLSVIEASTKAT